MTTITSVEDIALDTNNFIVTDNKNVIFKNSKIIFKGKNNYVFLEKNVQLVNSTFICHGDNSVIFIKKTLNNKVMLKASLYNDSLLFFNEGCSFNQVLNIIASESRNVLIGRDVMFSLGCWMRTSDVHMIYDKNGNRINQGKDIIIGDHVWIGQNVSLLKGTNIGSGSILGAGSVVAKNIFSNCINAGNPCNQIRKEVFWDRKSSHFFTSDDEKENMTYYGGAQSLLMFEGDNNLQHWQTISRNKPLFQSIIDVQKYVKILEKTSSLIIRESLSKESFKDKLKKLFKN